MKAPNAISAAGQSRGAFQVTAADISGGTFIGYSIQFGTPGGDIDPDDQFVTPGNGVLQIRTCLTFSAQLILRSTASFPNNNNSFTQVRVRGVFNSGIEDIIVARGASVYQANDAGECDWRWGQPEGFPLVNMIIGNKYALDFDP